MNRPTKPVLALRSVFRDVNGRLPLFDGRAFVYRHRDRSIRGVYRIDVWFEHVGAFVRDVLADPAEIFEAAGGRP